MNILKCFILCALGLLLNIVVVAKGLKELGEKKPDITKSKSSTTTTTIDPVSKPPTKVTPDVIVEPIKKDLKTKTPPTELKTDANSDKKSTTTPPKAPRVIQGNFMVETGFGWAFAKPAKGSWKSSGYADVLVAYKFYSFENLNLDMFSYYRYAPIYLSGDLDAKSYLAVFDTHNMGVLAEYGINEKLAYITGMEVGLVVPYVSSFSNDKNDADIDKLGANFAISQSMSYKIESGFKVGAKFLAAFGRLQNLQIGFFGTFVF